MQNQTTTIRKEADKCSKAFQLALEQFPIASTREENIHRQRKSVIQNSFERFKIWLENVAVGSQKEASLEDRLKGKKYIADYVLGCLRDLKDRLDRGKPSGAFLKDQFWGKDTSRFV